MKQSDIFTVLIVAVIGVLISSFLVNMILGDPNTKSVSFKTVDVISAGLAEPDPEVFNADAINPTVEVYVGDCLDLDQNGVLDEAEKTACGRVDGSGSQNGDNNDSDNGNNNANNNSEDNDTIYNNIVDDTGNDDILDDDTNADENGEEGI